MRTKNLQIVIFLCFVTLLFSEDHVPWSHIHYSADSAECYAYAIVSWFSVNRTLWVNLYV